MAALHLLSAMKFLPPKLWPTKGSNAEVLCPLRTGSSITGAFLQEVLQNGAVYETEGQAKKTDLF